MIDMPSQLGAQQQTRRTPQRLSNDGQTDGRTDGCPTATYTLLRMRSMSVITDLGHFKAGYDKVTQLNENYWILAKFPVTH